MSESNTDPPNPPPPTTGRRKRARRWGDAAPSDPVSAPPAKTSRLLPPPPIPPVLPPHPSTLPPPLSAPPAAPLSTADAKRAKALQLKANIAARLAALKQKRLGGPSAPPPAGAAPPAITPAVPPPPVKRAKVYDLDLSQTKRVEVKKTNPYLAHTETVLLPEEGTPAEPKEGEEETPPATTTLGEIQASNEVLLDSRLAGGQTKRHRSQYKPLTFIEPGTFVKIGERKREKSRNALSAGFSSGRKDGVYVKGRGMLIGVEEGEGGAAGENVERMEEVECPPLWEDGTPRVMEWWDVEVLLPMKLRKEVVGLEGKAVLGKVRAQMAINGEAEPKEEVNEDAAEQLRKTCHAACSITHCKTHTLIQHPPAITTHTPTPTTNSSAPLPTDPIKKPPRQAILHLTKKELKRQRSLRLRNRRELLQDQQSAGLLPPPEPRLTLTNFMRVLGDQAVLDPSRMESAVLDQIRKRKKTHDAMNAARKLNKEQRSIKHARKLWENTENGVSVGLFVVKDMGHPYHRTKVDTNAVQNSITGGVLECGNEGVSLVIAEGGPNAIRRFTRLMTVRMKWKGETLDADPEPEEMEVDLDNDQLGEDGEGEGAPAKKPVRFNKQNWCHLLWSGMNSKRMFNSFMFQSCATSDAARKILEAKGVGHFWDQVLVFHRQLRAGNEGM